MGKEATKPSTARRRGRPKKVSTPQEVAAFLENVKASPPPQPFATFSIPLQQLPPVVTLAAAPPKRKKIAILGSAPASVGLAPFKDPEWEIWACSPANKGLSKVDVWFELHNLEVKRREGLSEWIEWLKRQPKVYLQAALPDFPGSLTYPLREMIEKWGPFWFTSQVSYMLALAIAQQPEAIGLYGVDMAANSEYNQQRLACQYFIQQIFKDDKIKLVVPPESDLLEPAPLYGYCESSRQWRKYYARQQELQQRVAAIRNERIAKENEEKHLVGALDDLEYHMAHWANRRDFY